MNWAELSGERVPTCAIITCEAGSELGKIHGRVPIVLEQEAERLWLTQQNPEALLALTEPLDESKFHAHRVSTFVNNSRNDSEECILPIEMSAEALILLSPQITEFIDSETAEPAAGPIPTGTNPPRAQPLSSPPRLPEPRRFPAPNSRASAAFRNLDGFGMLDVVSVDDGIEGVTGCPVFQG